MAKIEFKTNINCSSCIRSVTNFIEEVEGITKWSVNTDHSDKILTVEGTAEITTIIEAVEDAGFDITPRKKEYLDQENPAASQ